MSYALSDNGIKFVKLNEGVRLKAYLDGGHVPTIGYGTTVVDGVPVKLGMTCTQAQAEAWLKIDSAVFGATLARLTKVPLTQNQVDALIDFLYNCGGGAYQQSSLRKAINARLPIAEDLFTRWNKIKDPVTGKLVPSAGLTARRKREYKLFMS